MQRIFLLGLAFVVSLGAAIGVFLYVSLIPYFSLIGKFAAGLLAFGLVCVAILTGVFTYSHVGIMLANRERAIHHRRVITAGDVVAYLNSDGNFTHLSALHEQAKVQLPATVVNALPEPAADDKAVLELYKNGSTLRDIASMTGRTYYQVQKITAGK